LDLPISFYFIEFINIVIDLLGYFLLLTEFWLGYKIDKLYECLDSISFSSYLEVDASNFAFDILNDFPSKALNSF